jgi:hypothetical protein
MNESDICIRVWTRDNIPSRLRHIIAMSAGDAESAVALLHVPKTMLSDPIFQKAQRAGPAYGGDDDPKTSWIGPAFLGFNGMDYVDDPSGDGYYIIGSWI